VVDKEPWLQRDRAMIDTLRTIGTIATTPEHATNQNSANHPEVRSMPAPRTQNPIARKT
jgi:hypothetical protein